MMDSSSTDITANTAITANKIITANTAIKSQKSQNSKSSQFSQKSYYSPERPIHPIYILLMDHMGWPYDSLDCLLYYMLLPSSQGAREHTATPALKHSGNTGGTLQFLGLGHSLGLMSQSGHEN